MSDRQPQSVFQAYERAGFGAESGLAALHRASTGWQEVPFAPSLRLPGMAHDEAAAAALVRRRPAGRLRRALGWLLRRARR